MIRMMFEQWRKTIMTRVIKSLVNTRINHASIRASRPSCSVGKTTSYNPSTSICQSRESIIGIKSAEEHVVNESTNDSEFYNISCKELTEVMLRYVVLLCCCALGFLTDEYWKKVALNMRKMSVEVFFGNGGILHKALMFMMKLGWKSRFRLPVLIAVAFLALDERMELEIHVV